MTDKLEPLLPRADDGRAFGVWPFASHNHNVVMTCILGVFSPAADSVWQGTVLTTFLYLSFGGSNSMVGFADAARGIFTLFIALPIGWAADRWPRKSRLIAIGGLLAPLASGLTIYAVANMSSESANSRSDELAEGRFCGEYVALVAALCIWGGVYTIAKAPVQALYASSTRAGERSGFYTLKYQLGNLAAAVGRGGTILIFAAGGDKWRLDDLRLLIYAGLALEGVAALTMLGFRDGAMLPKESEEKGTSASALATGGGSATGAGGGGGTSTPSAGSGRASATPPAAHPRSWMVPWILFASSLCFGVGAGATVKYFPLFFKEELHLSPVAVQLIFVLMPAANAAFSS